ncbi:MAG: HEPN domain-containing protein [Nitrospirae bacterium]|nr:HEPN domain-containing protein [Nitrospirota bacterium]
MRTAINMSYYAVYLYAASQYTKCKNNDPSIESAVKSHVRLILELKKESDDNLKKIGNQLFNLKKYREHADYDMSTPVSKSLAEFCYRHALRIKETIEKSFM